MLDSRSIGKVFETLLYLKVVGIRNGYPYFLRAEYTAPWASKFWVAHTIVQTLASACLPAP